MEDKLNFEEGLAQLEGLAQALERGEMSLEDSFAAYARACQLKRTLEKMLDEGDRRIRVLTEQGEEEMEEQE